MRFHKARIAMVAAALGAALLPTTAFAGWFSSDTPAVEFNELLKNAAEYKGETVRFKVYFNAIEDEYNPYFTEFHRAGYGNFGAWPMDARLYTKRDFQRCYPHFFVRRKAPVWNEVRKLDRFDAIEVLGKVTQVFHGRPHIDVIAIDTIGDGMDDDEIKDAIRAQAYFLAGDYRRAASLYRSAVTNDVPELVRADLYRRLGDAEFMDKDFGDARSAYERALRYAPESSLLKRNIEACDQARGRRRGDQDAQLEGTKRIAHYLDPILPDMSNGVDLIIAALEDPKKAQEEEQRETLALARRSVLGTGGREALLAADPEPTKEDERTAAAEGETEPMTEEPAAEEPAVEEPKVEAPVVEQPKAPEPKVEEPQVEEPKVEEPKVQEPEVKTPEVEQPKVEEPKAEEPKVEEPKVEEPVVEEPKAPEPKVEEPKVETPEVEAPEVEEPMTEEPAGDETMTNEPSAEERAAADAAGLDPADAQEMLFDESSPRVMKVGNTLHLLPRLPFYGCTTVTYEQFRAVVEEIMDTEDDLMVDDFSEETPVDAPESAADEGDEGEPKPEGEQPSDEPEATEPETTEPNVEDPSQGDDD